MSQGASKEKMHFAPKTCVTANLSASCDPRWLAAQSGILDLVQRRPAQERDLRKDDQGRKGGEILEKLEELAARVAICELKARYFRAVDMKDWEAFAALFEEDATLTAADDLPGIVFRGRAAIRAGVANSLENVATVHFGHMPELRFDGPDQAQGIWSMEDELFFSDESSSPLAYVHGYGHYHERYRRVAGEWRLVSVELRRLRVDTRPR